ncbi:DoxX family membrane protein [Subtercola boreus]|uniref:DoxX family protein n=1 Tax=Subtercola boreus TaxID=120213 RepID=A0A3E0WF38_9MICO|nr:DoxX family membrane protein [Subtercola boreus]RFA22721.1 DoxX family protein [Subtercola boreus]RFA23076.1 DoxX family protein [Subtercola boreus]RFA28829.1 DoxX family protein [Subtercola boreus]
MSKSTVTPAAVVAQTVFRVALGSVLIAHGSQKLFGWFGGGGVEGTAQGMESMGFRPARQHAVLAGVGEAGAGAALALGLATPAAGAAAAITMGVAASVHTPNGFFASQGGLEYPAVLGLAAAAFSQAGAGAVSLDSATRNVFNQPWMRVVALTAIPVAIGVQVYRRRKALAADVAASPEVDSVEDAAADAAPDEA